MANYGTEAQAIRYPNRNRAPSCMPEIGTYSLRGGGQRASAPPPNPSHRGFSHPSPRSRSDYRLPFAPTFPERSPVCELL